MEDIKVGDYIQIIDVDRKPSFYFDNKELKGSIYQITKNSHIFSIGVRGRYNVTDVIPVCRKSKAFKFKCTGASFFHEVDMDGDNDVSLG